MIQDDQEKRFEELFKAAQEEFPGITREEYRASLDDTYRLIREKYYSKDGYLKPRLVRPKPSDDPITS